MGPGLGPPTSHHRQIHPAGSAYFTRTESSVKYTPACMIHPNLSPGATAEPPETPGRAASNGRPAPRAAPDDAARFRQFAGWTTLAVFTFGILGLLGAGGLPQPGPGVS